MDANTYLQEHSAELSRKYPGKYIAIVDGEIVAVASNPIIAYNEAREKTRGKDIAIFYISSDDERAILI